MKNHAKKFVTFAAVTASATAVIHISNKIIAASALLKGILENTHKYIYNWRFGKIHYTKTGKGSPVLLIHDTLPGSSSYEWKNIQKELAMKHTVYSIDLLGYGNSDKPLLTYTNFVYTQLICDFVKNVIGEKTNIIASGFSGSFAIMACRNEKDCFNKIVLINPPSISTLNKMPNKKTKLLKNFLEIPVFGTLIYNMLVSRENLNDLFIEKMYYNPFHVDQDMVDAYYESSHIGSVNAKAAYACFVSNYMNINISNNLKVLDNSILIIGGEAENGISSVIDTYTEINPAIEAVTIKKAKHLPHVEDPEAFLDHIAVFL